MRMNERLGGGDSGGGEGRAPSTAPSARSPSPVNGGGKLGSVVLLALVVLVGCGREEAGKGPGAAQHEQAQLLPGQAPPVRRVEFAIPAKFDEAGLFAEGLAPVRVGGKFGYTDTKGDLAIIAQFDFATRFSEGLAGAGVGAKVGYIDKSGNFVVVPQFGVADLAPFSEGLAAVRIGEFIAGKWGYIDKKGNVIIQAQFDAAGPFSDGLAVAAVGNQFGYIDKAGMVVIPMQYASAGSFSDGLAAVRMGDVVTGRRVISTRRVKL